MRSEFDPACCINEVSTSLLCTYILALCLMVHSAQSKMGTTSIKNLNARGFLKKPSVQKLWREKANMQIGCILCVIGLSITIVYGHTVYHTPCARTWNYGGALRCLEVHWAIGCTVYLHLRIAPRVLHFSAIHFLWVIVL